MRHSLLTRYLIYQLYHAIHLINAIKSDGASADIHQFRVALRRVRSLVKLYFKDPEFFPKPLKTLVKRTNIVRELDVLLSALKPKNYPKTHKLLTLLRQQNFQSVFTDAFTQEIIRALHTFYDDLSDRNGDFTTGQYIQIAHEHYQHCLRQHQELRSDASKKELHELRIEFKTARYSLEFLHENDLSDEQEKIRECKTHQDTLGEVQDTFNQLSSLKKLYKKHPIDEIKELIRIRKKLLKKTKGTTQSA